MQSTTIEQVAPQEAVVSEGAIITESPQVMEMGETIVEQPSDFTSEKIKTAPSESPTKAMPPEPAPLPKPAPQLPEPAATPQAATEPVEAAPQPEAAPAQPEAPAMEGLDEGLMEEPPATEEPAQPAPNGEEDELDDLFGSLDSRTWSDDTGRYATTGRLMAIGTESVRILKSNGRFCTVPLDRLSAADFTYVQMVAKKSGKPSPLHVVSTR